jgi:hypothetical protein
MLLILMDKILNYNDKIIAVAPMMDREEKICISMT